MVELQQTTRINAPIERCFFLSLSIDLEMIATHGLRAVRGCTSGLIENGQIVEWEARVFGLKFHHTSRIATYEAPRHFQDTMIAGVFQSFAHDHSFKEDDGATRMDDLMRFSAPFGLGGRLAEIIALRPYMLTLLHNRNHAIQNAAESTAWRKFIPVGLNI